MCEICAVAICDSGYSEERTLTRDRLFRSKNNKQISSIQRCLEVGVLIPESMLKSKTEIRISIGV